jgi:hypothetical protein
MYIKQEKKRKEKKRKEKKRKEKAASKNKLSHISDWSCIREKALHYPEGGDAGPYPSPSPSGGDFSFLV